MGLCLPPEPKDGGMEDVFRGRAPSRHRRDQRTAWEFRPARKVRVGGIEKGQSLLFDITGSA